MRNTGIFASKEDLEKLRNFAEMGWMPGERVMVFSVGEGIRKDEATIDARRMCHKLALQYGLPEIPGYYGIKKDGEFVSD